MIPSGTTDRVIYFEGVNASNDYMTLLTDFRVFYSRNGGPSVEYTSPTVFELDPVNRQGEYYLLVDEGTTIQSNHDIEEMTIRVKSPGMVDARRALKIYRPESEEGKTLSNDITAIKDTTDQITIENGLVKSNCVRAIQGARIVNVTVVDDGATPIESATVRLTKGAETDDTNTDVNGLAPFSKDDGTWTVSITAPGYSFAPTPLVVLDDVDETYSMNQTIIAPAVNPAQTTGFFTVRDDQLAGEATVSVHFRMVDEPEGTGAMFDRSWFAVVSAAGGLVEAPLAKGGTYEIKVAGCKQCLTHQIPVGAGATYEIPNTVSDR